MHNAPPSPFLQSSLHTSRQSGVVDVLSLIGVVLVIVVNDVVVCSVLVMAVVGFDTTVDTESVLGFEPVTLGVMEFVVDGRLYSNEINII